MYFMYTIVSPIMGLEHCVFGIEFTRKILDTNYVPGTVCLWGKFNNEHRRKGHVHLGFASFVWK